MPVAESNETKAALDLRKEVEERSRQLESKQHQLHALLTATKNDKGERVIEPYQAEQIRDLEGQCVALTDQVNALKLDYIQAKTEEDLNRRKSEPLGSAAIFRGEGGEAATVEAQKSIHRMPESLGEAFVNSSSYKAWVHGSQHQSAHVEVPTLGAKHWALKATLLSTTGPFTSIDKQPGVVQLGQQMLTIADLFAQAQTNNTTVRYIQEDTFTNAADMVAEEGQKPEASWDLSEVDATVRKIAVLARVTDELFQDYPGIRDYVNDRLPFMVRQKEELELLNGDGTGQHLLGVLQVTGILTQAKGADTNVDAIYKGMTKVRTQGFFEPDAIVIDPTNWTPIRLLKTTTGEYVWGAPSVVGPETLFGKSVVVTANMIDNTALVGAFRIGGTVFYRQGMRVEATNSDASDFQYNRIALRAEQRETLVIWRPKAFCTVTGLST
jgi:HK97 family phage major capsid protein